MHFPLNPQIGVGPVKFGMSREEVHAVIGQPHATHGGREYFFHSGFHVHYDENGKVEFVELAKSEMFIATYRGADLHSLLAAEVVDLICKDASFDESDPELGSTYVFPQLQLSLWRSAIPEGADDDNGRFFEAVGLGKNGYFDA